MIEEFYSRSELSLSERSYIVQMNRISYIKLTMVNLSRRYNVILILELSGYIVQRTSPKKTKTSNSRTVCISRDILTCSKNHRSLSKWEKNYNTKILPLIINGKEVGRSAWIGKKENTPLDSMNNYHFKKEYHSLKELVVIFLNSKIIEIQRFCNQKRDCWL